MGQCRCLDNVLLAFEYLPNRGDNDKANIVFDCYVDSHVMIAPSSPINGKASDRSEERFSRNAETDFVCRLLLEKNA